MNELFQIQPQCARARFLRSNPLAIEVEMPDRPMRAERPFALPLLLLAIVYLMTVLTPTSASAARLDSAEALAAWAKSKNWTKTSYGIGYESDKINSFDIWLVYDRTPTLTPFNESWKGSGRDPEAVTRTGENITIAGGIPATLLYLSRVRKASGDESEKWEYYCHDYRVLMRAHRDTQIGQVGSDPLALLENYIAFVNKYLNVQPPKDKKDVMDNIDTPPPGKIIGGTDEPMLPTDQPITGIQGEVTDEPEPEPVKYVIVNDLKGDVRIDYGNFVTKQLKAGDHINFGDIVVVGDNSWVHFWSWDGKADFYINGYSEIQIVKKHIFPFKVRPKKGFLGTAWFLIKEGAASIKKTHEDIMIDIGIWDADKIDNELAPDHVAVGVHGSIVRVTHNKNSGDKSIAVVEGEAIVICSRQPEMLLSVKPGEKLTLDKYCRKQKYNLTKSEIQQITSVFPDVKKTTSLTPIADAHVYAYSYRNWNKANWGKYENLGAGWNPTGGEKRTYLKFDLSGIDPQKVGKATLKLFHYHTGGNNSLSLGVHAVTSPWQEGGGSYHSGQTEKSAAPGEISWVHQPTFDLSPVASFKPGPEAGKYIEMDITPLVIAWLTGKPNYGLVIKPMGIMSGRAPESSYGFYSRERQDRSKRPALVLSTASEVQGTARLLTVNSNRDMVGRGETFRGNGTNDAIFRAKFSAPGRTVTAVEVSNTNGLRSVWDTRPNNRLWLGGVVIGGRTMNRSDGSVNFSLGSAQNTLDFFVEDNGSIGGGKTNYRMTIFFASGDPLVMNIIPGGGGPGSSGSNTLTGTQHPPGGITKTTGTGPTGFTLDFETGRTNGWTKTGTAFDHQPTYGDNPTARHRGQPSKHVGNYWVGTYEKYQGSGSQQPGSVQGDSPTGTLTSSIFTIPSGSLSFLVGGGSSPQTRIELLVSGNRVLSVSGRGTETMHRVTWDLNPWAGQQGRIRIVDNASGGWGHINADDFRFSHSSSTGGTPGGIRIVSATYGGNCGVAKGNVTAHIAKQCNGKSKCRYVVDHKIIGDPAYGCAKTYTVRYRCGNNPQVFEKSLPAEAGWGDKAVLLECADSSGEDGGTDTGW